MEEYYEEMGMLVSLITLIAYDSLKIAKLEVQFGELNPSNGVKTMISCNGGTNDILDFGLVTESNSADKIQELLEYQANLQINKNQGTH